MTHFFAFCGEQIHNQHCTACVCFLMSCGSSWHKARPTGCLVGGKRMISRQEVGDAPSHLERGKDNMSLCWSLSGS